MQIANGLEMQLQRQQQQNRDMKQNFLPPAA
jgi:hypothetical protein